VKQEEPVDASADYEPKSKEGSSSVSGSNESESELNQETVKEIYLCLRPIRAGRHKVDEKYRFPQASYTGRVVSEGSKTCQSSGEGDSSKSSANETLLLESGAKALRLHKKRSLPDQCINGEVMANEGTKKSKSGVVMV
jgi:hypothetical protein